MTIRIEDLLNNRAVATDHMAGTARRHGKVVGFGDSDGRERIVPAEVSVTDGISHSISGQASNGEDDTIDACRILAAHLSSSELAYSEPVQLRLPHIDALLTPLDDSSAKTLRIQVR